MRPISGQTERVRKLTYSWKNQSRRARAGAWRRERARIRRMAGADRGDAGIVCAQRATGPPAPGTRCRGPEPLPSPIRILMIASPVPRPCDFRPASSASAVAPGSVCIRHAPDPSRQMCGISGPNRAETARGGPSRTSVDVRRVQGRLARGRPQQGPGGLPESELQPRRVAHLLGSPRRVEDQVDVHRGHAGHLATRSRTSSRIIGATPQPGAVRVIRMVTFRPPSGRSEWMSSYTSPRSTMLAGISGSKTFFSASQTSCSSKGWPLASSSRASPPPPPCGPAPRRPDRALRRPRWRGEPAPPGRA